MKPVLTTSISRSLVLVSLLLCLLTTFPRICPGENASRPNIVFILLDDLRWDEMDYPFVQAKNLKRIGAEGVRFENAFVTTPLCSPSRASFLTGQYAHNHGITDNTARDAASHKLITFPRLLHDGGYETAFVGKWHMGLDDNPRPGIDYWVSIKGQGVYLDPEINDNGTRKKEKGYVTDIFSEYSLRFLEQPHEKPFLLYVAHKAVHPDLTQNADGSLSDPSAGKFIPAPRHEHLYDGATIPHRSNYGEAPRDKPALLSTNSDLLPLGPKTGTDDETIRNRLRMLESVDEATGKLLAVLEKQGRLNNTLVILTSDEGYFYGEHGLSVERRLAYEESARIPLLMRYPKMIRSGSTITQSALNIDIAPTLLEIAGLSVPTNMDGRSLLPLLRGEKVPWRSAFLIEYYSDKVFPRMQKMGYQAVRTDDWKYIHYLDREGQDELYNLKSDPYELTNQFPSRKFKPIVEKMKAEQARLLQQSK
jgi:N-acetylglucosamine-6-sulfatase